MARRPARRHDEEEDDPSSEDDDSPENAPPTPRSGRSNHRPTRGVRPWSSGSDAASPSDASETEEDAGSTRRSLFHRSHEPVYWRARDSLFFEPLVALAIIVVLLVGLFAYTQNWPPMYVVESESMQHGTVDQLGLINTGDLVLAQKIDPTQIVPYMTGLRTGYQTYGEFGDVVLYHPNGESGTPIIHRAILYVYANPDGTYSVPGLNGLPCGSAPTADYRTSGTGGCATTNLGGTLTLLHIGWRSVTVSVSLDSLGPSSGFLTMGDNNFDPSNPGTGVPDEPGLTSLVEPGWVVGVARGMLPWFGAVKLLLEGNANEVPTQSWQFLGITIVALVAIAFLFHYVAGAAARRGEDDESEGEDEDGDEEEERPKGLGSLRLWKSRSRDEEDGSDDDEGPDAAEPPKRGRGRPRPSVRKGGRGSRTHHSPDGPNDGL